jgi:nicotinamide phosphoribosyltransferase
MRKNIVTLTDSYKMTHYQQYPKDTEVVYSYFESRTGAKFDKTVFVGLQYFLKEYLEGVVVTQEKIDEAEALASAHFMNPDIFNKEMWQHIVDEYGGKLPVRIKAVPEGTPVPTSNVLMTVENTDPKCFALTNHLETLLTQVWHSSTVASLSRKAKSIMFDYLTKTSDQKDSIMFQLHDFGMRGVSSMESAGIGGMGHLVNFFGTDTVNAMETARDYYNGDIANIAYSVPATEHSVMTAEGPEGEADVTQRVLDAYPVGIVSIVSDSYNIENFINNYIGGRFKDQIMARNHDEIPCKVVVRPDSLRFKGDTPHEQMVWIANALWAKFGGTVNSKGFKVLDPHIGLIWGDGIDLQGIEMILESITEAGFSTENVVFGMGGGLLQKINRDTQRFAFKCSAQKRSGEWIDVYKKPLDESKASKKGRLALVKNGDYRTVIEKEVRMTRQEDLLKTVFENGEVVKEYSFDELRENAKL